MVREDLVAVFGTHGGFVADQVRIGPAEACRTHRLVGVDHYLVFGGLLDTEQVMVYQGLAVMMLSEWDYVSDIAALDGVVAVFVHQGICFLKVPFIIDSGSRTLVMHYELDSLGVGIFIESLEVEVRIWGHEVEDIVLLAAEPVFPAFVPSFD